MPLCLNPAACDPEYVLDVGSELVALRRTSDAMLRERRENLAARLARQHFVLVRHVLPHVRVEAVQGPSGEGVGQQQVGNNLLESLSTPGLTNVRPYGSLLTPFPRRGSVHTRPSGPSDLRPAAEGAPGVARTHTQGLPVILRVKGRSYSAG